MSHDIAQQMQDRLRADLRSAMLARKAEETSVLRALIAAIDNAQSVPVGDLHARYQSKAFGDADVEVPRQALSREEIDAVLASEADVRRSAAKDYARGGHDERAAGLVAQAEIVERYRS